MSHQPLIMGQSGPALLCWLLAAGCWLLAKSDRNAPLPGARTAVQTRGNAGALQHGRLPQAVMDEIERLPQRNPEGDPRAR